jgi:hypothetical protein
MFRILTPLRRRQPELTHHLDDATLASLLRGDVVARAGGVAGHLSGCASCRRRMETTDLLRALFEEVPMATSRTPVVAMPAAARLVPRPHWQVSAGLAAAVAAALALLVAHQPTGSGTPPVQAQALTDVQRVTAMIRAAEQNHDQVALQQALVEAKAQLAQIDVAHAPDPQLSTALASLDHEVATLPDDPNTAALIADVEVLIAEVPGESPAATPEPTPDPTAAGAQPSPDAAATPTPVADATPSPSPAGGGATTTPTPTPLV